MTGLVRINRLMAQHGLCSRREADRLIRLGRVRVDGVPALLWQRFDPSARIEVDDDTDRRLSVMMHKPVGYLSQSAAPLPHQRFAVDLCTWGAMQDAEARARLGARPTGPAPCKLPKLACAGRLDQDSSGLLVLTQDGVLARQIVGDPELGQPTLEKEYIVQIADGSSGRPLACAAQQSDVAALLSHGLHLDGAPLRPCTVGWVRPGAVLRMVLTQGRKRQIRRMLAALGLDCLALHRVRVGGLRLGALQRGRWRFFDRAELLGPGGEREGRTEATTEDLARL